MSNMFTYVLSLQDRFSSVIERAGGTLRNTTNNVNRLRSSLGTLGNNLTGRNRVLAQSFDQIQARVRQVENTIRTSRIPSEIRSARRELEALQRQSNMHMGRVGGAAGGKGSGGGLMGMLGGAKGLIAGAGIGLAMSIIPAATGFVSDSISKSLERQQIQTSFNVLAGDEAKGSALTKQLVGLQNDTVLGSEVFKNAQTMMGFGFDSSEVYDNMKMLGDVSMGDAGKLQSLTLAFSQIRAAGKLAGQDLLQLINAGFNPLEQMSKKTGKSIGILKDEMEKGNISFADVQQAFKDATGDGGRFENMLNKIAATPAGKLQQLTGQWDEFKIKAGEAFMPLVSMALDFASKLMPVIEGFLQPLTDGIQGIVDRMKGASTETGGWMDKINTIRVLFSEHILPYASELYGLIFGTLGKFTEFVGKSELLGDIFKMVAFNVGLVYDTFSYLIKGVSWWVDNIVMPMLDKIEKVYRFVKGSDNDGLKTVKRVSTIAPPFVPGSTPTTPPATNGANTGGKGGTGNKTANNIATGGSKTTHITLQIGEMGNNMTVIANNVTESAQKIKEIVQNEILSALYSVQANT